MSRPPMIPAPESPPSDARSILLIDDDEPFIARIAEQVAARGYRVMIESDSRQAAARYAALRPDAVVVDFAMPHLDGFDVMEAIRQIDPRAAIILLSGFIDVPNTVRALRGGAEDVLTKPVDPDHLVETLRRGIERTGALRRNRIASTQVTDLYGLLDGSPMMERVVRAVELHAESTLPVLVTGEAGTGKRTIAQMLHRLSSRGAAPLVRVACAEREGAELTAELLGAPGARGALSRAHGGTLLLEDVHALAAEWQQALVALLRGEPATGVASGLPASDFRLVVTSSRPLEQEVAEGRLRPDFFQRIAVLPIHLPPLRRRGEDAVRTVAVRMLHAMYADTGRGPRRLHVDAAAALAALDWPGNFPQLARVLEGAVLRALDAEVLAVAPLRDAMASEGLDEGPEGPGELSLAQMERRHIRRILALVGGNRSDAARALGITRTTLYKKMSDYGLGDVGRE